MSRVNRRGEDATLEMPNQIKRVKLAVDQRLLSLTMHCDDSAG